MKPLRATLLGGLTVAVINGLDAVAFFAFRGVPATRVFQGIAGGLIGRDAARDGGGATVALGVAIHLFIATTVVAVLVFASQRFPELVRRPFVTGPIYGIGVWLVIIFLVVPLSATGRGPFMTAGVINGLLIHMIGVGIPAALFARATVRQHGWHRYDG